jgi:arylsulfatase A
MKYWALILAACWAVAEPISVTSLLKKDAILPMKLQHSSAKITNDGDNWSVRGQSNSAAVFGPPDGQAWDVSAWQNAGVTLTNRGHGVVTVEAELRNPDALSWRNSSPGSCVIPPGETATVAFMLPRPDAQYKGNPLFNDQLAKPNGHRMHWRSFNLRDVRSLRLVFRSTTELDLQLGPLTMSWPADSAKELEQLPYLDVYGQVRMLEWPEKATSIAYQAPAARAPIFNRFGGWKNGPQLPITGHFRTQKIDGRWWLVDPDGRLFFSTGVTGVGADSATPITKARSDAGFFAWLPDDVAPLLRDASIRVHKKRRSVNFPAMNYARAFGKDWQPKAIDLAHRQLAAAGLNTLGAWSDTEFAKAKRTPYTLITNVWWPVAQVGHDKLPSPFAEDFQSSLRKQLAEFAWAKDDPYCLGIFIDNEIHWPDRFSSIVNQMADWEPTRKWVAEQLKARGTTVVDSLYEDYARAYFAGCKEAIEAILPGKLYLGCRTHRGPAVLGRAAEGYVDVFSFNAYAARPRCHQVPANVDIPILASEFHFGAFDRGVPSPGLHPVHDQVQRGLAYANYLAGALADTRMVGVHWFQWFDQSAAGRRDRENHQCGVVDVTGRAYPEFTAAARRATAAMYPARQAGGSPEEILEKLIGSAPQTQPNVLVFLMDDMGYGDCRAYNPDSKVPLPNIERLAAEGMRFTDAHSPSAVCAPTRYSVLTGNYPWRGREPNGTWMFHRPSQILNNQRTVGHLMQAADYDTGFIGKVHLGGQVSLKSTGKPLKTWKYDFRDIDFAAGYRKGPFAQGFHYAYSLPQGIQGPPYIAYENGRLVGDPAALRIWPVGKHGDSEILTEGFGSPDWDSSQVGPTLTEKALAFLDKPRDKPFFLYYASQSCHVPHTPPREFRKTGDPHLDILIEADATLGKLLERVRGSNTLVIFTSDNGGLSRGKPGAPRGGHNSNAPLRGSKAQVWEGGHRVPFIAHWPSEILAGSSDALIGLQDLYATLLDLTDQPFDPKQGLDSVSFLPQLKGAKQQARSHLLVQANNENKPGQHNKKALRHGPWKLIFQDDKPDALYNLDEDLSETHPIDDPARVAAMAREYRRIITKPRSTPEPIQMSDLRTPQTRLKLSTKHAQAMQTAEGWRITGPSPIRIDFAAKWDVSPWTLVGIPMLNQGSGLIAVDGRLNNSKPTSWSRHCLGFGVAPAGEAATLGFVFPKDEAGYTGPDVFRDQLAKPNGHRMHWRRFDPTDVRSLQLDLRSSSGEIDILLRDPITTWAIIPERDATLQSMPYLDKLGQVRALNWPGKAAGLAGLSRDLRKELKTAAETPRPAMFSKFGGWTEGPTHEATGHFRTQKIDGRWWLIDPEGHLFFSLGVTSAGWDAKTAVNAKRRDAGFFAWLPEHAEKEVNFPQLNYLRALGKDWQDVARAGIHDRLQAWGVNTLGSWADKPLQRAARTPYTLIASLWWPPPPHGNIPSPFRADYESDLREALQKYAWAKDDPFCLGIFLGNELEWPDTFTPTVLGLPDDHPTKVWARQTLGTDDLQTAAKAGKLEPLYFEFARAFFAKSKTVIEEVLPGKLYLGCRTHRGPSLLGRAAVGHVDVFSVNVYDSQARHWQVGDDADIPVLAGEFHFGAPDRGVPSPGLAASWDQTQRGYAFANYLASALASEKFVGVHWFRWLDQSAAGRFDRENHQCGFVDVTGRAYPEFTSIVSRASRAMYPARASGDTDHVKVLERLLAK